MGLPFLKLLYGLCSVGRQPDLETGGGEKLSEKLAVILDVVSDQHPARRLPGLELEDMPGLVFRQDGLRLPLLEW